MKLINKDILAVAKIASKDRRRYMLNNILLDHEKMVATDGYKLLEVKHSSEYTHKEFPTITNSKPVASLKSPLLLDAGAILKSLKFPKPQRLPILNEAVIVNENDTSIGLAVTDLVNPQVVKLGKVEGDYPQYENLFPTAKPQAKVRIDSHLLAQLLAAFKGGLTNSIILEFHENGSALVIKGDDEGNSHKRGLIMPLIDRQ